MSPFDRLIKFYRRQREIAEMVERGGWRIWIWCLPVVVVMLLAFALVVGTIDANLQTRQLETQKELRNVQN